MRYMLLIYGDESQMGSATEEQMGQVMEAYKLYEKLDSIKTACKDPELYKKTAGEFTDLVAKASAAVQDAKKDFLVKEWSLRVPIHNVRRNTTTVGSASALMIVPRNIYYWSLMD